MTGNNNTCRYVYLYYQLIYGTKYHILPQLLDIWLANLPSSLRFYTMLLPSCLRQCVTLSCALWVHNILTTVMTNIIVSRSTDIAEPCLICYIMIGAIPLYTNLDFINNDLNTNLVVPKLKESSKVVPVRIAIMRAVILAVKTKVFLFLIVSIFERENLPWFRSLHIRPKFDTVLLLLQKKKR